MLIAFNAFASKCQALTIHTYYAHNTNRTEIFFASFLLFCHAYTRITLSCSVRIPYSIIQPYRYMQREHTQFLFFYKSTKSIHQTISIRNLLNRSQRKRRHFLLFSLLVFANGTNKNCLKLKNRNEELNTKTKNNISLTKNERVRLSWVRFLSCDGCEVGCNGLPLVYSQSVSCTFRFNFKTNSQHLRLD